MSNWKKDKDLGPWDFTPSVDKPRYDEGHFISTREDPIWPMVKQDDIPMRTHAPCGYWTKSPVSSSNIIEEKEYIYIIDASGFIDGEQDFLLKKEKGSVALIDYYGGKGTGIDELWCPTGCCVNDDYIWIADYHNERIMVREKNYLTYVNHYGIDGTDGTDYSGIIDVDVDNNYTYDLSSTNHKLIQRLLNDPTSIIKTLDRSDLDIRNQLRNPKAMVVDNSYIYIADEGNHRVLKINKDDFTFTDSWGYGVETIIYPSGMSTDGTYIYVADFTLHHINKINLNTQIAVAMIGHATNFGPDDGEFNQIREIDIGSTHMYICDYGNHRLQKVKLSDMSFVAKSGSSIHFPTEEGDIYYPTGIAVEPDESYIYVADWTNMVTKFDSDFTFVAWSGDPNGDIYDGDNAYYLPTSLAIDNDYLYIVDLINARIVQRNKSDMLYVDEYDYSNFLEIESDVSSISCDGTYLYATATAGTYTIHRIDITNMTYVDGYSNLTELAIAQSCCLYGTDLYIGDRGTIRAHIDVFDTSDLVSGVQDSFNEGYITADYVINNPYGIAVDDNYIYVTDTKTASYGSSLDAYHLLKIHKSTGDVIAIQDSFEFEGLPVPLDYPTSVDVDDDFVYLTNQRDYAAIVVFNKSDLSFVYSDPNEVATNFEFPYGICVDK